MIVYINNLIVNTVYDESQIPKEVKEYVEVDSLPPYNIMEETLVIKDNELQVRPLTEIEKHSLGISSKDMEFRMTKENKLQELKYYDKSNDINDFSFAGQDMWITRNDRQTILTRLNSNKTIGLEKDTINGVELPIDTWIGIISQIENYASKCYDKTQEHKSNIEKLTTKEEVENYNFKVGYPDKLEFEL